MHKNNALMSPNLVDEPKLNCGKKKITKVMLPACNFTRTKKLFKVHYPDCNNQLQMVSIKK